MAASVFYTGWNLLAVQGLKPEHRIDSTTLFDLVKLSFGVVAGAGALVALVVAYRRQRVDEDGALREATRLHTERFTTAVSQLGDESAAVRLGGVHALAGLADDAPTLDLRQTCIDVLCAYLRLPYTAEADLPDGDIEARNAYLAMREVRHTVIRLIGSHLRLPKTHSHSWQGLDFDFTGVTFDGGDFSGAVFSQGSASFRNTRFSLGRVDFSGAVFSGGSVSFRNAEFSSGTVTFSEAMFVGSAAIFGDAGFSGSTVYFSRARFSGSAVTFNSAEFSSGTVVFSGAKFVVGAVSFDHVGFSGGEVSFSGAEFIGGAVSFRNASFSNGRVSFIGAEFSVGTVSFRSAEFSGSAIIFSEAMFIGSALEFSGATGEMPFGLVSSDGSPEVGVRLPLIWRH